ncbi:MAG: hypothetical protein ACYSYV_04635 [Planctomycetota bacterium]|jgi:hypothetical protein
MFDKIADRVIEIYFGGAESFEGLSKEQFSKQLSDILKERFGNPILPNPGESIAISTAAPKTAALFFDKIWSLPAFAEKDRVPETIEFYGASELEIWSQAVLLCAPKEKCDWEKIRNCLRETPIARHWGRNIHFSRSISEELFALYGLEAATIYSSSTIVNEEYAPGRMDVVFSSIDNIKIVDESKLEWNQILEFRNDDSARRKYRNMIQWFNGEMLGRPCSFISQELEHKLEDYEWALKKHGIETGIGILSSILNPKFVASTSVAVAGISVVGDKFWAAIGGLCLMVGQSALSLAKRSLDLQDLKRKQGKDIAYVHEIKNVFDNK